MSCRRANAPIDNPGVKASRKIQGFSSNEQRRRRSMPVNISIQPEIIVVCYVFAHGLKDIGCQYQRRKTARYLLAHYGGAYALRMREIEFLNLISH